MDLPERPIPESYWVVPGRLLAGEYPGVYETEATRKRVDDFLQAGFNTFIDLTRPNENRSYKPVLMEEAKIYEVRIEYHNLPVGDFGVPSPANMRVILDTIDSSVGVGKKVYIHCWAGIGRTGTAIGCYLVRQGKSGHEALEQLSEWWRSVPKSRIHPHSPETDEQIRFILNWQTSEGRPSK